MAGARAAGPPPSARSPGALAGLFGPRCRRTAGPGERAERMRRSPQFRDGKFRNSTAGPTIAPGAMVKTLGDMLRGQDQRTPRQPIPLVPAHPPAPDRGPAHHLVRPRVHAGRDRRAAGPARSGLERPLLALAAGRPEAAAPSRPCRSTSCPPLDAIVISHDHYDHLDMDTVKAAGRARSPPRSWCRSASAPTSSAGACRPSASSSWTGTRARPSPACASPSPRPATSPAGRFTRDGTLWGSWVIAGPRRKVFYTGDTGYFDGFAAHRGGARAVRRHAGPDRRLRRRLARHPHDPRGRRARPRRRPRRPDDPGALVHLRARPARMGRAGRPGVARGQGPVGPLAVPRPGERIDVDNPPEVDGWWQAVA